MGGGQQNSRSETEFYNINIVDIVQYYRETQSHNNEPSFMYILFTSARYVPNKRTPVNYTNSKTVRTVNVSKQLEGRK